MGIHCAYGVGDHRVPLVRGSLVVIASHPWFHRKQQWDRGDRVPWICIHWRHANGSRRVFVLDARGGEIGARHFRWPWVEPTAGEILQKIRGMK
jgi:hypothetical protein